MKIRSKVFSLKVRHALQVKLRKLEQTGLSDDENVSTPASKTPIGPPSSSAPSAAKSATSSSSDANFVTAKDSPPSMMHSTNSMDNVRKICEQLAQINVQKAAASSVSTGASALP